MAGTRYTMPKRSLRVIVGAVCHASLYRARLSFEIDGKPFTLAVPGGVVRPFANGDRVSVVVCDSCWFIDDCEVLAFRVGEAQVRTMGKWQLWPLLVAAVTLLVLFAMFRSWDMVPGVLAVLAVAYCAPKLMTVSEAAKLLISSPTLTK
jgi:hypothetical protein